MLAVLVQSARAGALAALLIAVSAVPSSSSAQQACSEVEVIFARGSGELPGLGIVGAPLATAIKSQLPDKKVSVYAVNYAADVLQTSAGPGATDLTNRLVQVATMCPETTFVLGGYSQGASVVDIALGVPNFLGMGKAIPAELRDRVAAVVLFGNPLALMGGKVANDRTWGARTKEYCAAGDPVCAGGLNGLAHVLYPIDGSVANAAEFAVQKVREAAGSAQLLAAE